VVTKRRCDMTINEMIVESGWFHGTERDWQALSREEQAKLSFQATGCTIAFPTWEAPVDCSHPCCKVARGEQPPMYLVNGTLKDEMHNNWLRFEYRTPKGSNERNHLARLCILVRNKCRELQVWDPWKIPGGWQCIVYTGVGLAK
jgi:hypothetical protein